MKTNGILLYPVWKVLSSYQPDKPAKVGKSRFKQILDKLKPCLQHHRVFGPMKNPFSLEFYVI